jgi:hypothetical protein
LLTIREQVKNALLGKKFGKECGGETNEQGSKAAHHSAAMRVSAIDGNRH